MKVLILFMWAICYVAALHVLDNGPPSSTTSSENETNGLLPPALSSSPSPLSLPQSSSPPPLSLPASSSPPPLSPPVPSSSPPPPPSLSALMIAVLVANIVLVIFGTIAALICCRHHFQIRRRPKQKNFSPSATPPPPCTSAPNPAPPSAPTPTLIPATAPSSVRTPETAQTTAITPIFASNSTYCLSEQYEAAAAAASSSALNDGEEASQAESPMSADLTLRDHHQQQQRSVSVVEPSSVGSMLPTLSVSSADSAGGGLAGASSSSCAKQKMKRFLKQLLAIPGNDRCADCGCPDAKWTSLNIGAIICIECSGVHRSLGVHFSKFSDEAPEHSFAAGQRKVNAIFLRNLPNAGENAKIGISRHTNRESREQWIIAKYVEKKFALQPSNCPSSTMAYSRSVSSLNDRGGGGAMTATTALITAAADQSTTAPPAATDTTKNDVAASAAPALSNVVKLRQQNVRLDANVAEDLLECRLSRASSSSFGSDSNLVQSARAAIAQRASACFARGDAHQQQQRVVAALRTGCLEEVLRAMVQDGLDINNDLHQQQQHHHLQHRVVDNTTKQQHPQHGNNATNAADGLWDDHQQQQQQQQRVTASSTTTTTTPLHIAVENNQTTMIEFLLLNGAKINGVDGSKNTPLTSLNIGLDSSNEFDRKYGSNLNHYWLPQYEEDNDEDDDEEDKDVDEEDQTASVADANDHYQRELDHAAEADRNSVADLARSIRLGKLSKLFRNFWQGNQRPKVVKHDYNGKKHRIYSNYTKHMDLL